VDSHGIPAENKTIRNGLERILAHPSGISRIFLRNFAPISWLSETLPARKFLKPAVYLEYLTTNIIDPFNPHIQSFLPEHGCDDTVIALRKAGIL
jgi:hypothetical protein